MSDEVYVRLREFLDKLPGGFPATDNGIELRILEKYFTPEQAEFLLDLKPFPEPASAIAERAGVSEEHAAEMLETMAKEGSIFRIRVNDQPLYMAISFVIGIYEFHLKSLDRELAELLDAYVPHMVDYWSGVPTKQLRVVPIGAAVGSELEVATYDTVRDLVNKHTEFAVADCICRVEKGLLGQECDRPMETCLVFGIAAQYYVENGLGRKIDLEECLSILDMAEKSALVLSPTNAQEINNICCCCSCCCGMLRGLRAFERPADHVGSTYQARIDPDLCTLCGDCLERCQIEALTEGDDQMEVDLGRCIGCGLCLPTCPESAIAMVPKAETAAPPANVVALNLQIASDRGLS
jgi:ferredoxin/DNA-binding Lrp family transcriptional regulator